MTKKEAVQRYVGEFNAIPQSLIKKAYYDSENYDAVDHLTAIDWEEEQEGLMPGELPMWGTMWQPNSLDEDWIKENLETVKKCGFEVYESDELGIFVGINGAGYDFYEAHWTPLYEARGLQWHKQK